MIPAHANPFRMQCLEQMAFEPQGMDWPSLMRRLDELAWRAAVVGPHGSGKTTLLASLSPRLAKLGFEPLMLFMNREQAPAMPTTWQAELRHLTTRCVLLADGYDLLGPLARLRLRRASRRGAGLIVTSHRPTRMPMLIRCTTSPPLLAHLVAQLLGRPLPEVMILELHRRHRGNLRLALRELYDRAAAAER